MLNQKNKEFLFEKWFKKNHQKNTYYKNYKDSCKKIFISGIDEAIKEITKVKGE